jgi:hypothetical protein
MYIQPLRQPGSRRMYARRKDEGEHDGLGVPTERIHHGHVVLLRRRGLSRADVAGVHSMLDMGGGALVGAFVVPLHGVRDES